MKKIPVFIINYNGKQTILETIKSIYGMHGVQVEIQVLDDCSTDESLQLITENYPEIKIHRQPVNTKKPNLLRNQALKLADSKYVYITDNDIKYDPGCLAEMLKVMEENPSVVACIPRLMYWDDPKRTYLAGSKVHFLGASIAGHRDEIIEDTATEPTLSTGGGNALLDRGEVLQLGGFDQDYLHGWGEDGEFYQRIMLAGYQSLYVPTAFGYHEDKLNEFRPARALGQIFNRWQYIISHYSIATILIVMPALLLYEIMQLLFMLYKGLFPIYLKGNALAIKNIFHILKKRKKIQKLKRNSDKNILFSGELYLAPSLIKKNKVLRKLLNSISFVFAIYWKAAKRII
ncbi:glycosyltransferase [bacterium]|nr:glycosyltransferase [bacterium]